ncbi:MAG: hypothetical protein ABI409_00355 [Ramlibacter sp.]
MHRVEPKLADWHRLYKELETARARLQTAQARSPAGRQLLELEAEVRNLQQRSNQALEAVQSAITLIKSQHFG